MYQKIKSLNQQIVINHVNDDAFHAYGRILSEYDFSDAIEKMKLFPVPAEGNTYVACEPELMKHSISGQLSYDFYGNMPLQIGYCNGNSNKLNALEYHKSSEIDIAVTDLILLLSDIRRIQNNQLSVDAVEAFYVPAGTACELYATTLHFAPCRVSDEGFKSIIVLPAGTNYPLASIPEARDEEGKLLWMQNKWLIAHEESIPAGKGAFVGIVGNNIEIFYK